MDAQSEFVPHGPPLAHKGEHEGDTHLPLVQMPEVQSELAPQVFPWLQAGAHPCASHLPFVQTPVTHSPLLPQLVPLTQLGLQEGAAHLPPVQMPEAHCDASVQLLPSLPVPGAQIPLVHATPPRQSADEPQSEPWGHVGEQLGAAHLPLVQTFEPQSVLVLHPAPSAQVGEQLGFWQRP